MRCPRAIWFFALLALPIQAFATIHHVPAQHPDIQAGVDAAVHGDTVLIAPGTYTGAGNRGIELRGKNIAVIGSGKTLTTLDCEDQDPGFDVHENETDFRIESLGITRGFHSGIACFGVNGQIRDLGVWNCLSYGGGGGISVKFGGVHISDTRITNCQGNLYGGGVMFWNDTDDPPCSMENVTLTSCFSYGEGGGLHSYKTNLTVTDCVFDDNHSNTKGGAAHIRRAGSVNGSGNVHIENCSFVDNSADYIAVLYLESYGHYWLERNIFAFSDVQGTAIRGEGTSNFYLFFHCNDVFASGETVLDTDTPPTSMQNNIYRNPLLCNRPGNDFTLNSISPCLPANNDCGELIGAFGFGCFDPIYLISGTILDTSGQPIPDAEISGGPWPIVLEEDGDYFLEVYAGWSGTLTPSSISHMFTPESRSYANVQSDFPEQNYVGNHSGVHHVPGEYPTIQAAVDAALDGDSIIVAPGTYTGPGNRGIELRGRDLAIVGTGPGSTILDCEDADRAFYIHEGEQDFSLAGFSIVNGNANYGGGIRLEAVSGAFSDLWILDCTSTGNGGALYSYHYPSGHLTLSDLLIAGNTCTGHGGGISISNLQTLSIERITVVDNESSNGIAAMELGSSNLSMESCLIAFNVGPEPAVKIVADTAGYACNNVYGNSSGNYGDEPGDLSGQNGNISRPPIFCDRPAGDYHLAANSPCLPANNDCGLQMGVFGQGCAAIPHYVISGVASHEGGEPMADLEILWDGEFPLITGADGGYALELPGGWSGTLTPLWYGYEFTPPYREYADLQEDMPDQDYTATQISQPYRVPLDFPTIQSALDFCFSGDSVIVAPGVYQGEGNHDLDFDGKAVSLIGKSGSAQTVIDAGDGGWYCIRFHQGEGPQTLVQGFTLRDAPVYYEGGAISCDAASPTLRDLVFLDNHGSVGYPNDAQGGGIYIAHGGAPLIEDCVFSSNNASNGGAAYISGGTASFVNVRFEYNNARLGGAIYGGSTATFENCQFIGNTAHGVWTDDVVAEPGFGGALYAGSHSPQFTDCLFVYNLAENVGDAPYGGNQPGSGGAVMVGSGSARFSGCTFYANEAQPFEEVYKGGCFDISGAGDVELDACVIANTTTGYAVYCDQTGGVPAVSCSIFWENWAPQFGGACPDLIGVDDNLAASPRFCDPDAWNFGVAPSSPCLPDNNACGLLIGAYGQGCDTVYYIVSGAVTGEVGQPIGGVLMSGAFEEVASGPDGSYAFGALPGWSGTVTPVFSGFVFEPAQRVYTDLQTDLPDQDYVGINAGVVFVPDNFATIQGALDYSTEGDSIVVMPGSYGGDGNCELIFPPHALVLMSAGGAAETILEDPEGRQALRFDAGQTRATIVDGFTIRGCDQASTGMAILCENSSPTLRNLIIENCVAPLDPPRWGVLACTWEAAAPLLEDCVFRNNQLARGGALHCGEGAAPELLRVTFEGNSAVRGGALYIVSGAAPVCVDCVFVDNESSGLDAHGGAVYCRDGATTILLEGCTLEGNTAEDHGVVYGENATLTLINTLIAGNAGGGGIYSSGAIWSLSCCDVWGNTGGDYVNLADQTGSNGNIMADPFFCDPDLGDLTLAGTSPCLPENNDCGIQMGAFGEGCEPTTVSELPGATALFAPYPNPFNPRVTLEFALAKPGRMSLSIYDLAGRRVRTLLDESLPAGRYSEIWHGDNDAGRSVASGVYLLRMEAPGFTESRRLLLLR